MYLSLNARPLRSEKVYDEFVKKSAARAQKRQQKTGDAIDAKTEHTPVVDKAQLERIKSYIASGVAEGAKLVTGGKQADREGFFVEPTIFADVQDDMKIAKEEIFGPVMSILKYSNLAEAIKRANNTEFGLGAYVFSNNIGEALAVAKKLEAGTVWYQKKILFSIIFLIFSRNRINGSNRILPQTPFGGYKQSGIGRENGIYVLSEYLQVKQITVHGLPKL